MRKQQRGKLWGHLFKHGRSSGFNCVCVHIGGDVVPNRVASPAAAAMVLVIVGLKIDEGEDHMERGSWETPRWMRVAGWIALSWLSVLPVLVYAQDRGSVAAQLFPVIVTPTDHREITPIPISTRAPSALERAHCVPPRMMFAAE